MKRLLAFGLVAVQFVLIGALAVLPRGQLWPVGPGMIVVAVVLGLGGVTLAVLGLIGLGPALTASPIPRENAPLVTTGVFGLVRSPIYTGVMTAGLGLALFGASLAHVAAWVALIVLLSVKTRWEERMLLADHPEYHAYAVTVGRFIPGLGKLHART